MFKLFLSLFASCTLFFFAGSFPAWGDELEARTQEIQRLTTLVAERPEDIDLLWGLAQNYYHLGGMEADKIKSLEAYRKCEDYSQKAIVLKENSVQAHFWLGLCYGKEGKAVGMLDGLPLSKKIKKEMERVIELDPAYNHAGGHRALGRLLSKLPGVFGGDTEKARRHLEEAVRIAPEFSTNHLYLAEIFIQKKNYDLAYAEIETLLNHSFPDMDKKTLDEEKKRAEYLLLEIPKRIREKLTTAQAEKRLEHVREKH